MEGGGRSAAQGSVGTGRVDLPRWGLATDTQSRVRLAPGRGQLTSLKLVMDH